MSPRATTGWPGIVWICCCEYSMISLGISTLQVMVFPSGLLGRGAGIAFGFFDSGVLIICLGVSIFGWLEGKLEDEPGDICVGTESVDNFGTVSLALEILGFGFFRSFSIWSFNSCLSVPGC